MRKTILKIFIFISILFLTPKVFAQEFNMNSYTSATKNGTTNRYRATEIYNTGTSNTYTFGTQYSGRISDIETYFNYPFVANTTYTITYNMNTDDFRNNFGSSYWWNCDQSMTNTNATVVSPSFISMKKVKLTFRTTESTSCIRVWLRSTNLSSTAITGVSNWRLNNITIYDPDFQDGSSSGNQGSSSGNTTTDNTNSDIINANNQNTQEIIDNANQNTQDIIDNQNKNTEKTNELLGNCFKNLLNVNNGVYIDSSSGYGYPVNLEAGKTYTLMSFSGNFGYKIGTSRYSYTDNESGSAGPSNRFVFTYTPNSNLGSQQRYLLIYMTDPPGVSLQGKKFVLIEGNYNGNFVNYGEQACTSKLDETNNYLQDDSNPNIADNEFTSLFNNVGFNDPLSYLLQLPVQFINQLVSQSNTCQTISLGTLWGVSLSLPCINIGSIIGQQVWDIIDVLFSVGLLVVIFKNLYQTFANLMTMGGEKEAREKFSMPTPMEFLSIILGGDR